MPNERNNGIKSGYASVNGLKMYYEIHGAGRPLVLLHGSLTTIDTSFGKFIPTSFGKFIPFFAKTRQVIAVEQQAHGYTADVNRPLTYEQTACKIVPACKTLLPARLALPRLAPSISSRILTKNSKPKKDPLTKRIEPGKETPFIDCGGPLCLST